MAWLKLRLFLHADEVEVAGFGISAEHDLLYVEEFQTVKQKVTAVTVELDDVAVADHIDRLADAGIGPNRCARLWIHTHAGTSPQPSAVDEETFGRVFGACDWAVMAIIARGGASCARLRFSAGPGGQTLIPVRVDWERFPHELVSREGRIDRQFSDWIDEYGQNVHPTPPAWPEKYFLPGLQPTTHDERSWQSDALDEEWFFQEDDFALLSEASHWEVYP